MAHELLYFTEFFEFSKFGVITGWVETAKEVLEAGSPDKPAILLLLGFPASSFFGFSIAIVLVPQFGEHARYGSKGGLNEPNDNPNHKHHNGIFQLGNNSLLLVNSLAKG